MYLYMQRLVSDPNVGFNYDYMGLLNMNLVRLEKGAWRWPKPISKITSSQDE